MRTMEIRWHNTSGPGGYGKVPLTIAKIIGEEKCVKLMLEYGGSNISVVVGPRAKDSQICKAIGIDAARALGDELQAHTMRVPIGNRYLARYFRREGVSVQEIARRLRISTPAVRAHLKSDGPVNVAGYLKAAAAFAQAAADKAPAPSLEPSATAQPTSVKKLPPPPKRPEK